ncbi:MAG: hypothetical protein JWR03_2251, partial [Cohnella sp.]|nr:hypothetical protein [Cohnella sp.]
MLMGLAESKWVRVRFSDNGRGVHQIIQTLDAYFDAAAET